MQLKENLIKLMEKKKLTIKELSDLTAISIPSLKRLRTQDCNPTLDILIKLSKALDISIGELIIDSSSTPVFLQDEKIVIPTSCQEFALIFNRDTFSFKSGARALFKRYTGNEKLTKYILHSSKGIMCKINDDTDNLLFKDEFQKLHSIHQKDISGFIIKQLYEVIYD
jgi:transcriptional regulator with XRE-family HTH domain